MTHDVVHSDAAGEGNPALKFLRLLGIVDFAQFFLDELVHRLARGVDVCAWHD